MTARKETSRVLNLVINYDNSERRVFQKLTK